MPRGDLSDESYKRINDQLLDAVLLKKRAFQAPPDFVSMRFPHNSAVPIASVCFEDGAEILCDVRLALHEYYAHSEYYREVLDPPDLMAAVSLERFFLDDAALRLYAAAEHLANAIIYMLELEPQSLAPFRERGSSLQSAVGHYLLKTIPAHPLAVAVSKLVGSEKWKKTRDYRDEWVHEQPPPIQGTGIVYLRRRLWDRKENKSWNLTIGQRFEPELTTQKIHDFVKLAYEDLYHVFSQCLDYYEDRLREAGFTIHKDHEDAAAP